MRRENEQPLVHVEGGGAVHPTRLKQLPDAKRLSALPSLKEPLSRLRKRLAPQERTKKEIACDIGHYPGKKNFMNKHERRQLKKKAALHLLKQQRKRAFLLAHPSATAAPSSDCADDHGEREGEGVGEGEDSVHAGKAKARHGKGLGKGEAGGKGVGKGEDGKKQGERSTKYYNNSNNNNADEEEEEDEAASGSSDVDSALEALAAEQRMHDWYYFR